MKKPSVITKILAIIGTVFVWLPVVAPVIFSIGSLVRGRFNFDFLMPAEMSPLALLGGCLLFAAAWMAQARRSMIGWALVIAVGLLIGGQALAVVTGLASGDIEPSGWQFALVTASIAAYSLALIVMGVGGIRLLLGLFKPSPLP